MHTATVATLRALAETVHLKTEFDCPNCGEPVGPDEALSTAFTWAFPDEAGLVHAFTPNARDRDSLCWQFRHRRLDPQELPGWEPDPAEPVLKALDDDAIEEACGRVTNPKSVIREVLADWTAEPDGGAIAEISRDMTLLAVSEDTPLHELYDGPHEPIALADSMPVDLPTHRDPEKMTGRYAGWLPPVDTSKVFFALDEASVHRVIERAFDVANLSYERTESGYENITTPRDAEYPRPLTTRSILQRAAYTGLTPGDAARLTAEEIVGNLLRVW